MLGPVVRSLEPCVVGEDPHDDLKDRDVTARDPLFGSPIDPPDAEAYRSTFADAPIGMALMDVSEAGLGRFVRVNDARGQPTGSAPSTLVGRDYVSLTHRDDLSEDSRRMAELVQGTIDRYQRERRYIHARGHVFWMMTGESAARPSS